MKHKSEKLKKFDVVYNSHVDNVFKVSLFLLRGEENAMEKAEEVTVATFIKFYNHMEEIEPERVFAYLIVEARNMSHNYKKGIAPRAEEEN